MSLPARSLHIPRLDLWLDTKTALTSVKHVAKPGNPLFSLELFHESQAHSHPGEADTFRMIVPKSIHRIPMEIRVCRISAHAIHEPPHTHSSLSTCHLAEHPTRTSDNLPPRSPHLPRPAGSRTHLPSQPPYRNCPPQTPLVRPQSPRRRFRKR